MNLAIWDQPSDVFDYTQLAKNFTDIAAHDHSSGKGTQIDTAGIKTGAINDLQVNGSAAIAASKIAGTAITGATTAGGVLSGLYPNPGFANRVVDRVNIKRGIVPDIVDGDASGNGLPTTGLFDGYTVDYNFSKTIPAIKSGTINGATWTSGSSGTGSGNRIQYTTSANHSLLPGDYVTVTGSSVSGFNITSVLKISTVTSNTFTVFGADTYTPYSNGTTITSPGSSFTGTASFASNYTSPASGPDENFSWRLRYNGITSKWDCLGGNPIAYSYNGNPTITPDNIALDSLTPNGLSLTVPFIGNYIFYHAVTGYYFDGTAGTAYEFGTSIYQGTSSELSHNAEAYAVTIGLGSSSTGFGHAGTASTIYRSNITNKNIKTGFSGPNTNKKLTVTTQNIVIIPMGGLTA
jgi:hypothetical protein